MDEFFALTAPLIDLNIIAPYDQGSVDWARSQDWRDCAPWYRDYAAATVCLVTLSQENHSVRLAIASHAMREFLGALIG